MNQLGIYNRDKKHIFVVIKPGFLHLCSKIVDIFIKNGWRISMSKTKQLLLHEAHQLYAVHKNEDFYEDLCKYMSSGQSMAFIFTKPGKVNQKCFDNANRIKDIIRKKWGESEMRNVIHSSDSLEHMEQEAPIYFNM